MKLEGGLYCIIITIQYSRIHSNFNFEPHKMLLYLSVVLDVLYLISVTTGVSIDASYELLELTLTSGSENILYNIGLITLQGRHPADQEYALLCTNEDDSSLEIDDIQSWKPLPVSEGFKFGPDLLPLHLINLTEEVCLL